MTNEENQDVELDEEIDEVEEEVEEEEVEDTEDSEEEEQDWEAEAKKWKAIANRKKKKINKLPETKATNLDVDDRVQNLELAERKRQFGYENGLSPKETDQVFKISTNPDADTLNDPFIKAGLKAIRSQDRVDNNSPSISAKATTLQNKKFSKLSKEDKQVEFEKFMKSKGVFE